MDPSLTWRVITTEHFRVYFHDGEEEWAGKAAGIAEKVHSRLFRKLGWEPDEPTHLVLIDFADLSNGAALPFPSNSIYVTLTPPPGNPVPFLMRFEDWLRQVITHEYVHTLQLDMNTGFPSVMRRLFGKQLFPLLIFNSAIPNAWQPAWLIEGLATYEETAEGVSDRRDSAYAEMVLRMAILEGRFPTLDQAGGRETWPGGQIQYIFGAAFYDYLVRRFGESILKDLSLEYSDNVFPFFVGTTGRKILGQSYDSLWQNWIAELQKKYQEQKDRLAAEGFTPSHSITRRSDYNLGPRIHPKGDLLVYTSLNPHEYPALRIVRMDGSEDRRLIERNLGSTVSWSPDGRQLAFSQIETYRNYSFFSDLYLYDFQKKEQKRLTFGARFQDPDFHPDGDRLIGVETRLGKSRLVVFQLETGRPEFLDWIGEDLVLSQPRWSPDGKRLAVSVWKGGARGILLLELEQKKVLPVLMDPALDLAPAWSPDGRYIIFSSDRTGVYNLFAYSIETAELFQITHLLSGALTPEVTPDGREIVFSYYSSRGFDLHRMAWNRASWRKVEAPLQDSSKTATVQESREQKSLETSDPPAGTRPYSAWPTVRPRFWTPLLGVDDAGLQTGAATGGVDVLGKHKFDAIALYGTKTNRPAYSLQYVNDSFYPSFHAGLSDFVVVHTDLFPNDDDYWERLRRLDLDMTLERLTWRTEQSITVGYRVERFSGVRDIPAGEIPPEEGDLSGLRVLWDLNTAREYGFSISREDGRQLLAGYTRFDERLGSDFDQNRYVASWHEYLGLFSQHHVLAARLTGALATGDRLVQRTFQVGGSVFAEELIDPEQTEFFLRGYPARLLRGQKAALGSLEYRLPLQNIERGKSTWPFFFKRTHAALFYDIGNAWDEDTELSDFRRGIGFELKMDMVFGHWLPIRWRVGAANGLDDEGEFQLYLALGNSF